MVLQKKKFQRKEKIKMEKYDFSGWATKANIKCSDGRTIMKDAFKHNDGQTVPLVWNHQHNDPNNILGHALLENREDGVYAYCTFNDTESGKTGKLLVQHGDIDALSIYANQLKEHMSNVMHGNIREVSLVLAGANIGAYIDNVIAHGEDSEEEAVIFTGEGIELYHGENEMVEDETTETVTSENETTEEETSEVETTEGETSEEETSESETTEGETLAHADSEKETETETSEENERTVADVYNDFSDEEKNVVSYIVAEAVKAAYDDNTEIKHSDEGEDTIMKRNVFDTETVQEANVISHADQETIIAHAKSSSCGSFRAAMESYINNNELAHGFENYNELFPEYKDLKTGAPELLTDDQSWVEKVINKTHKSPISRIRTRQADARKVDALRGLGYKKGEKKTNIGNINLLSRTFDPQTIYVKDALNRDDIIDITDFDVIEYNYRIMHMTLKEEIATAIIFGDGREIGDPNKIKEAHICPIWTDDELYTIHEVVDIEAAKTELQGTNTNAYFSENYIYAEAIIRSALYAREQYKGSGSLDFYCTPHLLNVMLLARDMNGRRIYDSKTDLAAALNVREIITIEQMEGKTRAVDGGTRELLGIFYNFADYQIGATKGGEITRFNQFDIDFNQEKMLIETRISGANTRVKSAIVLEMPTVAAAG